MRKEMSIWDRGFECEVPRSDGNRVFAGVSEMLEFLRENNAGGIVYDDEYEVFRVPAWKEGRDRMSAIVQAHCDRYGCE